MSELTGLVSSIIIAEELARKSRKKYKGYTYSRVITVDRLTVIDLVSSEPYARLISITVYNDGDSDVYVSVNKYEKKAPLKPHETLNIKFEEPMIEKIFLDVDDGKSTTVRVFGLY
jgi:hypothetical protein